MLFLTSGSHRGPKNVTGADEDISAEGENEKSDMARHELGNSSKRTVYKNSHLAECRFYSFVLLETFVVEQKATPRFVIQMRKLLLFREHMTTAL